MRVDLQNVLGRSLSVRVNAHSELRATTAALRKAQDRHPGEGWRVRKVCS